jgi:phosphoribosylaminoimidazole-succinocarboxamide synthase
MELNLPGLPKLKSGKVREIFDLGDALLFVATDRISAFDVIMPNPIPGKGRVLTALSAFWFGKTARLVKNHFITSDFDQIAGRVGAHETLRGRSMLVRKGRPLPVECVVRGYLAGSGWKEYQRDRTVGGHRLPDGLLEASELPCPIFTPATKADTGHDQNIDFEQTCRILGRQSAERLRELSLALYEFARNHARARGIIIADTKFEFGIAGDELLLIDEALTPDSSRFWPASEYQPGRSQPSFDKQFVRDYLETLNWDKTPPAPALPDDIIASTSEKYLEALRRLTA